MAKSIIGLLLLAAVPGSQAAGLPDQRLVQGMNQFAADAYPRLARTDENLIFSPFNLFTALSMALDGAAGQTAREIAAVLHQPYPDAGYPAAFSKMAGEIVRTANAGGAQLQNANGLWVDRKFRVQTAFRQNISELYGAPLVPLDFSNDPEGARRAINQWTGERTKGKIAELFGAGVLDRSTRLVMSSAIYFYGPWQAAFRPQNTQPDLFHLSGGRTVETPFMNQSGKFGYGETPALQILEMKYAGGTLAMDILLPKTPGSLDQVEKSMSAETLASWVRGLENRSVDVSLPKFRATAEFPLRDVLAAMGMPGAFTTAADFSGIDDRRDLYISQVMHKAFVDVSEQGTEAAAATGIAVGLVAMAVPQHTVFRADHPFLFLIRDSRSGAILFAGRLANPN